MVSSESYRPESRPATATVEVLMDHEDHMLIRHNIVSVANELALTQIPRSFRTKISGVPLHGDVPPSMRHMLPDHYTQLSFASTKPAAIDAPESKVVIGFHDPYKGTEVAAESVNSSTEAGWQKYFDIKRYNSKNGNDGTLLDCTRMLILLDELTGKGGNLADLADQRHGYSFDTIAFCLGDQLGAIATGKVETTHTYATKDITTSFIERPDGGIIDYFSERGTMLTVQKSRTGQTAYKLQVLAPVDIYDNRLLETFTYSFMHLSDPVASDARLMLASQSFSQSELQEYAFSIMPDADPKYTYQEALFSLRDGQ